MSKEAVSLLLNHVLSTCRGAGVRRVSNGSMFVGPIRNGNTAWLHYVFAPCDEQKLKRLDEVFEFDAPDTYRSFLRYSNGALLYELCMTLSGVRMGAFSRGLSDEDVAPQSIEEAIDIFRLTDTREWAAGWRPIGELVAISRFSLQIREDGAVRVLNADGGARTWLSFIKALEAIVSIFDDNFGCSGTKDKSYRALESDLLALCRSSH